MENRERNTARNVIQNVMDYESMSHGLWVTGKSSRHCLYKVLAISFGTTKWLYAIAFFDDQISYWFNCPFMSNNKSCIDWRASLWNITKSIELASENHTEIMGLCTKTNSRTSSNVDVFVDSKLCAFKSVIFIFTFIIYVMKLCDAYVLWMKYWVKRFPSTLILYKKWCHAIEYTLNTLVFNDEW